ncbi:MAG: hypothetical protein ACRCYY_15100 [Trueperaceae bacterium]
MIISEENIIMRTFQRIMREYMIYLFPALISLLIPSLIGAFTAYYAARVPAEVLNKALVASQLFSFVGGSYLDNLLYQMGREWYYAPMTWGQLLADMKHRSGIGFLLAFVPGVFPGYFFILGPQGLRLDHPLLLLASIGLQVFFVSVYPALFLGLLRAALLFIPRNLVFDNSLISRNVVMTFLLFPLVLGWFSGIIMLVR